MKIASLNALRGIAAFLVAADHLTLIVYKLIAGSLSFYIATFFGSFAVGLFFLISGFVIPISLSKLTSRQFLVQRILRIYPVIISACLLRLMVEVATNHQMLNWKTLYILLLNMSLFSGFFITIPENIEPIVWTLAIEVKFYLLVAGLYAIFHMQPRLRYSLIISLITFLVAILYVCIRFTKGMALSVMPDFVPLLSDLRFALAYIPFMFIGTALYLYKFKHISHKKALWLLVAILFVYVMAANPNWTIWSQKELPSYTLALLTFVAALHWEQLSFFRNRIFTFLASISFPMYAVHSSIIFALHYRFPDSTTLQLLGSLIFIPLIAYLVHIAIENPVHIWAKKRAFRNRDLHNNKVVAPLAGGQQAIS